MTAGPTRTTSVLDAPVALLWYETRLARGSRSSGTLTVPFTLTLEKRMDEPLHPDLQDWEWVMVRNPAKKTFPLYMSRDRFWYKVKPTGPLHSNGMGRFRVIRILGSTDPTT